MYEDLDYKTVLQDNIEQLIVKKSKFISRIKGVRSEQEAFNFIDYIKKMHRDANHNVWAFCLKDDMVRRYSDDKEPKGTAGVPVLDVILKEGLKNVCIVVTRYFGGTMLGAGGLIRAYSSSASLVVKTSKIVEMSVLINAKFSFGYSLYDSIENLIKLNKAKVRVLECDYGSDIIMNVLSCPVFFEEFKKYILEISCGAVIISEVKKVFDYIEL